MNISLLLAKLLGVYLLVSGLFIILKGKTLPILVKDLFAHRAITHIAGALLLLLGGYIVVVHNVWDGTWRTWVTVLGWATLIKGVVYIFAPEWLARITVKQIMPLRFFIGAVVTAAGFWLLTIKM